MVNHATVLIPRSGFPAHPIPRALRAGSRVLAGSALLFVLTAGATAQATTQFTDTRRPVANFNVETIRGMAVDPALPRLWAINSHNSTLMAYDAPFPPAASGAMQPTLRFRTIQNPSAFQLWNDPNGNPFAIVVGGGTHGVVKQNRNSGVIEDFLELPSEPMDIVIDTQRNHAFVSCAGAFDEPAGPGLNPVSGGVVVEFDLVTFAIAGANNGMHFIDGTRPTFLDIEMGPGIEDNFVYVTPFLSGNRSTYKFLAQNPGDATSDVTTGLPDEDLFMIKETGGIGSLVSGAGTLLTAHGRNPTTGKYWILGVDSKNTLAHTEPLLRGRFAQNQLAISDLSGAAPTIVSLDGTNAPLPPLRLSNPTPFSPNKPASFPFGMAFLPASLGGFAFVVSSTGDTIRILSSSGADVRNIELPEGSIPRGVMISPANDLLFVYAWGLGQIFEYDLGPLFLTTTPNADPLSVFDLGEDPQPAAVKRGREIWYDADRSNDAFASVPAKVTCNTCHPRGATDMLGWDLTDTPIDRKDLMVTQSLLGIEDTFPYHWRGERALIDFNPAFSALLGASANLTTPEFDDFQAFVFSLQGAANPRQDLDRLADSSRTPVWSEINTPFGLVKTQGDAKVGETLFHNDTGSLFGFNPVSCADCHGGETGTNGLITTDVQSVLPTEAHLDVAHLRQMAHKFFQRKWNIAGLGQRPRNGFGFSQDGNENDITDFLGPIFFPVPQNPTLQDFQVHIQKRADAASFVAQFDEGIAPRAHHGFLFDPNHATLTELQTMIGKANSGEIDLVTVGNFTNPAQTQFGLWFDTVGKRFHTAEVGHPNDISFDEIQLDAARQAGSVRLLVMGVPPGNGFRFAVDHDNDGLSNTAEILAGTQRFISDSDGDGFLDGYEAGVPGLDPLVQNTMQQAMAADMQPPSILSASLEFTNGRVSKHHVQFSEPVTYDVQVEREVSPNQFAPFGPVQHHAALRSQDTLVAQHLRPSTAGTTENYRVQVTMFDQAGNQATQLLPTTGGALLPARPFVVLPAVPVAYTVSSFSPPVRTGNDVRFTVTFDDLLSPTVFPGLIAVVQVLAQNASGGFDIVATTAPVTGTSTRVEPAIQFPFPPQTPQPPPVQYGTVGTVGPTNGLVGGPLVLSPINSSGTATIDFSLPSTPSGTAVKVTVLGLYLEKLPVTTPPQFEQVSTQIWQTAMTDPALRALDFTF